MHFIGINFRILTLHFYIIQFIRPIYTGEFPYSKDVLGIRCGSRCVVTTWSGKKERSFQLPCSR